MNHPSKPLSQLAVPEYSGRGQLHQFLMHPLKKARTTIANGKDKEVIAEAMRQIATPKKADWHGDVHGEELRRLRR